MWIREKDIMLKVQFLEYLAEAVDGSTDKGLIRQSFVDMVDGYHRDNLITGGQAQRWYLRDTELKKIVKIGTKKCKEMESYR